MSHRTHVSGQKPKKNAAASPDLDVRKSSEPGQDMKGVAQHKNPAATITRPVDSATEADLISGDRESPDESFAFVEFAVDFMADAPGNDQDLRFDPLDHHSEELPVSTSPPSESSKPVVKASIEETLLAARDQISQLGGILRSEIRSSLAELQAAQAAAVKAQSEVLRTLTEVVFQASAPREVSEESLEKALSGIEKRLMDRFEARTNPPLPAGSLSPGSTETRASQTAGPVSHIKLQNAASSVTRSWEQIRSELVDESDYSEMPAGQESQSPEQLHAVTQLSSDRHFRLPEQDPALEIPETVDPESLSDDELRKAFRERESFISALIARVRRQQELATGQLSQEQLRSLVTHLPEGLANQVRHTLKQMDELARIGELELSMERARIARQVNQLEHTRHVLDRNARQLGWELNPDGTISPPVKQQGRAGSSSSRRWLSKLGFGQ